MNTKRKLALSIIAFSLVVILLTACVSLIFASNNLNISSIVSVIYKAQGFDGSVSARYFILSEDGEPFSNKWDTGIDMDTNGKEEGGDVVLNFNSYEDVEKSLSLQDDIELSPDRSKSVLFLYKFKNTGKINYNATVSFVGTITNMEVFIAYRSILYTDEEFEKRFYFDGYWNDKVFYPEPNEYPSYVTDDDKVDLIGESEENKSFLYHPVLVYSQELGALEQSTYIFIVVRVENEQKDALFSGTFVWNLSV